MEAVNNVTIGFTSRKDYVRGLTISARIMIKLANAPTVSKGIS